MLNFVRPFVKGFALCYHTVVCMSVCLSVCLSCLMTLGYCGQTDAWMKMKLVTQVGLGSGHIVLDGDPAPLPQRGTAPLPISAHICCGQIAGWIKMPLGIEVGFSPGDFVLDVDPAPPPQPPFSQIDIIGAMVIVWRV